LLLIKSQFEHSRATQQLFNLIFSSPKFCSNHRSHPVEGAGCRKVRTGISSMRTRYRKPELCM